MQCPLIYEQVASFVFRWLAMKPEDTWETLIRTTQVELLVHRRIQVIFCADEKANSSDHYILETYRVGQA